MNSDFARAMHRATASVRAQNLSEATAIIQAALAVPVFREAASAAAASAGSPRIDPAVEDAESVEGPSRTVHLYRGPRRSPARVRRPLGEVVRTLREGRRSLGLFDLHSPTTPPIPRPPAPELPDGTTFTWRSHTCAAGTRQYRLFVPSCRTDELRGLVVMLHGCKQDPDDFAAGTGMNLLAEEHCLLVAYPGQSGTANVSGCWNWFDPAHQSRDAGEPAILASLTGEIVAEYGVRSDRVFVAGLSAGGAMAAVLAETHPELFAAVGIHSGLAYRSASDVMSAFAAMRGEGGSKRSGRGRAMGPRLIVFHGTADRTVHPCNAESIVTSARAAVPHGASHEVCGRSDNGRGFTRSVVEAPDGTSRVEFWLIEGGGHAWSGGDPAGSYTDPNGPVASAEMLRFFLSDGKGPTT
jgi:poly(hydroxyalkanoate) depolymerase family esterase